ncbi:MAG: hypothetical protein ACRD0Y_04465 [Terriglobales bacterium]
MKLVWIALLAVGTLAAQQATPLQKAIALSQQTVYLSPDATSAKVGALQAGEQIGVQASSGKFTQVFSGISGWVTAHDFVLLSAPHADEVVFGAAAALQRKANYDQNDAETKAAVRLYLDIYTYLPHSARAGEALYRGAALQWDTKVSDMLPNAALRLFPDDTMLHRVENKFKGTPWAQRAAFKLIIEHFTCGDWFAKPECIGKEAKRYRDYVKKYPASPDAAEAVYDALYRAGIAWTIYSQPGKNQDASKAADARQRAAAAAALLDQRYPHTDWSARGAYLAFQVAHNSPLPLPATTPLGGP